MNAAGTNSTNLNGGCGIWWLIDVILIATKHKFDGIEWVD